MFGQLVNLITILVHLCNGFVSEPKTVAYLHKIIIKSLHNWDSYSFINYIFRYPVFFDDNNKKYIYIPFIFKDGYSKRIEIILKRIACLSRK